MSDRRTLSLCLSTPLLCVSSTRVRIDKQTHIHTPSLALSLSPLPPPSLSLSSFIIFSLRVSLACVSLALQYDMRVRDWLQSHHTERKEIIQSCTTDLVYQHQRIPVTPPSLSVIEGILFVHKAHEFMAWVPPVPGQRRDIEELQNIVEDGECVRERLRFAGHCRGW